MCCSQPQNSMLFRSYCLNPPKNSDVAVHTGCGETSPLQLTSFETLDIRSRALSLYIRNLHYGSHHVRRVINSPTIYITLFRITYIHICIALSLSLNVVLFYTSPYCAIPPCVPEGGNMRGSPVNRRRRASGHGSAPVNMTRIYTHFHMHTLIYVCMR